MLVYPGMILLDLVGPFTAFNILQADVHFLAKSKQPVMYRCRVARDANGQF